MPLPIKHSSRIVRRRCFPSALQAHRILSCLGDSPGQHCSEGPAMSNISWEWKGACGLVVAVTCAISTVRGEPPRLSVAEQDRVNQAIDRGVRYLQATQQRSGTWATSATHVVGYTALPALTLLECGVSPKDDRIQRAAAIVRRSARTLATTYELSLAILFLDRLGEARDRPLIQTFAARLIAGQCLTGGWSYRCPVLTSKDQQDLFTVLRQLETQPHFDPVLLADGKTLPDLVNTTAPGPQGLLIPSSERPGLTDPE